ncbi:hypothetical protein KUTeg_021080 [Tegillarca granosa]|uniref:Uncharacterized protein n=1 Tax=Tegillarca granosa TaxID=220873 RepID=A0ABQ9E9T5_TEGGR|nr:hypothetical protein KUTeg_021080 [Tegillarca granosa]
MITFQTIFNPNFRMTIEGAASRQGTFYYNVSLPHFLDEKYLNLCVLRYKKFLYLKLHTNDAFLVPCYDNDLIWHTHQLFPKIYYEDTCRILGSLYNHDDSTTDRSPGSKLSLAYANTTVLWKNMYCERYSFPGAMYRGACSKGRLTKYMADKRTDCQKLNVQFNFIALNKIPDCCQRSKFKIKILYGFRNTNLKNEKEEIASLKGDLTVCDGKGTGVIRQQDKVVCEGDIDIKALLGNAHSDFGIVFQDSLVLKGVEDLTVYFTGQMKYIGDPYKLYLIQGQFQRVHKPSSLDEVVDIDKSVADSGTRCCECEAARHSTSEYGMSSRICNTGSNHVTCNDHAFTRSGSPRRMTRKKTQLWLNGPKRRYSKIWKIESGIRSPFKTLKTFSRSPLKSPMTKKIKLTGKKCSPLKSPQCIQSVLKSPVSKRIRIELFALETETHFQNPKDQYPHCLFFVNNNHPVFDCIVLHGASSNFSAVQVVKDDKVLAVGTLIDSSHLPLPAQVSSWFCGPTLSPAEGERAFLITDDDGDWALIVGKWLSSDSAFKI